jgi:tetratricopeptide (TPR) repeat protein
LSEVQRVVELDPLSGRYNACLGYLYDLTGQHGLAVEHAKCATDLDPNMYMPRFILALAYGHMGRFEEALAEANKACDLCGRNSRALGLTAWLHGVAGQRCESRTLLEELTTQRRTTYVPPSAMALAYRGLGEAEQVLEWLERGVEERDLMIVSNIKAEPLLVERGHPRYNALLRKMNLES